MGYVLQIRFEIRLFTETTKSWLIAKSDCCDKAIHIFKDTNIQITTLCKKHLGEAVGASQFRNDYIMENNLSFPWTEELHILGKIEKIEAQAAHTFFLSGYKHKFNHYMRTRHRQTIKKS